MNTIIRRRHPELVSASTHQRVTPARAEVVAFPQPTAPLASRWTPDQVRGDGIYEAIAITRRRHPELVSASTHQRVTRRQLDWSALQQSTPPRMEGWTVKQVQGDGICGAIKAQKPLGISLDGSVG